MCCANKILLALTKHKSKVFLPSLNEPVEIDKFCADRDALRNQIGLCICINCIIGIISNGCLRSSLDPCIAPGPWQNICEQLPHRITTNMLHQTARYRNRILSLNNQVFGRNLRCKRDGPTARRIQNTYRCRARDDIANDCDIL